MSFRWSTLLAKRLAAVTLCRHQPGGLTILPASIAFEDRPRMGAALALGFVLGAAVVALARRRRIEVVKRAESQRAAVLALNEETGTVAERVRETLEDGYSYGADAVDSLIWFRQPGLGKTGDSTGGAK